jgi:hypothetical protein
MDADIRPVVIELAGCETGARGAWLATELAAYQPTATVLGYVPKIGVPRSGVIVEWIEAGGTFVPGAPVTPVPFTAPLKPW